MLKLLKTIMRAGTATVKYPFAPLEVRCPANVLPAAPVLVRQMR